MYLPSYPHSKLKGKSMANIVESHLSPSTATGASMSSCQSITICLLRYSMHTATPEPALIFPPCNRNSINPSLLLSFFLSLNWSSYNCWIIIAKNQFYNRVHTTFKTWPLTSESDFSGEISRETIVVLNPSQSDRCVSELYRIQKGTICHCKRTPEYIITLCHNLPFKATS